MQRFWPHARLFEGCAGQGAIIKDLLRERREKDRGPRWTLGEEGLTWAEADAKRWGYFLLCHMFTMNLGKRRRVSAANWAPWKVQRLAEIWRGGVFKQLPVPFLKTRQAQSVKGVIHVQNNDKKKTKHTVVNRDLKAKPRVNTPQTNPEIARPVWKRVQAIRVTAKCHRTGSCTRGAFSSERILNGKTSDCGVRLPESNFWVFWLFFFSKKIGEQKWPGFTSKP